MSDRLITGLCVGFMFWLGILGVIKVSGFSWLAAIGGGTALGLIMGFGAVYLIDLGARPVK
jgi:cytochrome c oxidase assembly factor CtaG